MSETSPASPNDAAEPEEAEVEAPLPADFDLAGWIAGVQPTIRSATLYQRADLLAVIEDLERRLQIEEKAAEEEESLGSSAVADLSAELEEAYQAFVGSAVTFKVQGRSADWLGEREKQVKKSAEANGMTDEQKNALAIRHQLAGGIVEPAGITPELLATLEATSWAQYQRLVSTFLQACSKAPAVSVPFSQSSSEKRGGRRRS